MKCKKCGNDTNFILSATIALWDNEKELWIEERGDDYIQCEDCLSCDIEDENWDFEN